MIYYIEYNREQQKILSFLPHPKYERAAAQNHAFDNPLAAFAAAQA